MRDDSVHSLYYKLVCEPVILFDRSRQPLVTPTEKKFRIGVVEGKCVEGEGEGGLYGMACVCEEGSVFDGEEGIGEYGEEI